MQLRRRNPDDNLTGKDLDQVMKEMRLMSQEKHWGERCDVHQDGCPTCDAWKHFDKTGEVLR